MQEPLATIVIVPRERFSFTRDNLESILQHTEKPYNIVYVDGGSPKSVRDYIQGRSFDHDFRLVRRDHYLSPNRARNLGIAEVRTKYAVFIDNDVVVTPGWLKAMVDCAEETGAAIVGPLTCQGTPIHETIHCAGGECGVRIVDKGGAPERRILEKIHDQGKKIKDMAGGYERTETGLAEFHCVLARRDIFDNPKIGPLDEKLLNTKEHVDFCMMAAEAGEKVYFEPTSLVTYVPGPPLKISDMPFYMLRWSDAWETESLNHLMRKWNLNEDDYFRRRKANVGWRRNLTIIKPLVKRMAFGGKGKRVQKWLQKVDHRINRFLTDRYKKSVI